MYRAVFSISVNKINAGYVHVKLQTTATSACSHNACDTIAMIQVIILCHVRTPEEVTV